MGKESIQGETMNGASYYWDLRTRIALKLIDLEHKRRFETNVYKSWTLTRAMFRLEEALTRYEIAYERCVLLGRT